MYTVIIRAEESKLEICHAMKMFSNLNKHQASFVALLLFSSNAGLNGRVDEVL